MELLLDTSLAPAPVTAMEGLQEWLDREFGLCAFRRMSRTLAS